MPHSDWTVEYKYDGTRLAYAAGYAHRAPDLSVLFSRIDLAVAEELRRRFPGAKVLVGPALEESIRVDAPVDDPEAVREEAHRHCQVAVQNEMHRIIFEEV